MIPMKRRSIQAIALLAITFVPIHLYIGFFAPPDDKQEVRTLFIPPGASFRWVALKLEEMGVIRDADRFSLLARMRRAVKQIKAGEYEFTTSMSPWRVLDMLIDGRVKEYTVTIPEGYNLKQIAELLASKGLVEREDFLSLAYDREFIESLGLEGNSLEGYLFPDTYRFNKLMGARGIVRKMVDNFNRVYREIEAEATRQGLSMKEVVTLASIIEKEAKLDEEKPLISAVFHNRLRMGLKLQSDPTVIYGLPSFDGNLRKEDLLTPTPYNTYIISGLPPGPISNPGRASLIAAVRPAPVDYLYFVSRNDGSHHFSRTLMEHNRAVMIYQKKGE